MTATGIQEFLDRQAGPLKNKYFNDHNGVRKSAAEIIADAAKHYNVSPRVILVTLQKEQSLLSKTPRKQSGYDWAMGCGRPDSGISVMKYKGFGNQIWGGAQKFDKWDKYWTLGYEDEHRLEHGDAPERLDVRAVQVHAAPQGRHELLDAVDALLQQQSRALTHRRA